MKINHFPYLLVLAPRQTGENRGRLLRDNSIQLSVKRQLTGIDKGQQGGYTKTVLATINFLHYSLSPKRSHAVEAHLAIDQASDHRHNIRDYRNTRRHDLSRFEVISLPGLHHICCTERLSTIIQLLQSLHKPCFSAVALSLIVMS